MLNRYIAWKTFCGILGAFAVIASIVLLVDFVETSRNISANVDVSLGMRLALTGLNAPQVLEPTLPFAVLFGVMAALFALNKKSEIIVMRACGLSVWRFLMPVTTVACAIGIFWTIAINPFAAYCAQKHLDLSNRSAKTNVEAAPQDIWLREGNEDGHLTVHAKTMDLSSNTLFSVSFYYNTLTPEGNIKFQNRYDAKSAKLYPSNYWVLRDVLEHNENGPPLAFTVVSKPTHMTESYLRAHDKNAKIPSFWQMRRKIKDANHAGYDPTALILGLHKLLALPITLIAMVGIAACASLRLSRSGGSLGLLISGASLGFGVYFVDNMISAFGGTGTIPPVFAAWSIPIFTMICAMAYLTKLEDG